MKMGPIEMWKRSRGKMKEPPDWAVEGVSLTKMYYFLYVNVPRNPIICAIDTLSYKIFQRFVLSTDTWSISELTSEMLIGFLNFQGN
jgi:hypothetical protein